MLLNCTTNNYDRNLYKVFNVRGCIHNIFFISSLEQSDKLNLTKHFLCELLHLRSIVIFELVVEKFSSVLPT